MKRKITFVSSNFTWGGSEVLWSRAAARLAAAGHTVTAYKNRLDGDEHDVALMGEAGVRLVELARFPFLPRSLYSLIAKPFPFLSIAYQVMRFHLSLRLAATPNLVVVSQGGNHDGWLLTSACRRLKLPYVLLSQKATDLYWPQDKWLNEVQANYDQAKHAYFVSRHNLALTEEQIGTRLSRASVVRNPFNVGFDAALPWPEDDGTVHLACIGRLYPKEKGQDILLRVLARPEWRARKIRLTFYGAGEQRHGLEAMARFLQLDNVHFGGHVQDIEAVWRGAHLLVLPSRAEGLPLVLVEAMLCGRVSVVTDVAGNREVLTDEVTGFVAESATEDSLSAALERAWARKDEWQQIGRAAADHIRSCVPPDPAQAFAEELLTLLGPR